MLVYSAKNFLARVKNETKRVLNKFSSFSSVSWSRFLYENNAAISLLFHAKHRIETSGIEHVLYAIEL